MGHGRGGEDHHAGLRHDLEILTDRFRAGRRQALRMLGGASLIPILGCGEDEPGANVDASGGSGVAAGYQATLTVGIAA